MKTSIPRPSVSYSFTIRLGYPNRIGMLAQILRTIGNKGGDLGAVDIVSSNIHVMTRDITTKAQDEEHAERIVESVRCMKDVKIIHVSDRIFLLHLGGKITIQNKVPITTRDTLSLAYTPGVARICRAIAHDTNRAYQLTIKKNSVAIVSDGTAILGLGDLGPAAAMPVMEGKAMLFKEFANIDAYPICLRTKEANEIVETVFHLSTGFGGINLEDISAPRCFEIEKKLQERLDIPVFHDDQHGTAIVVLAALINTMRLTHRKLKDLKIVVSGAGAAGVAITKMLLSIKAKNLLVCDSKGIIHPKRRLELNESKLWLAEHTNPRGIPGSLGDALRGANVFIGVSGPNIVDKRMLRRMAPKSIVFALANPTPEVMPEEAASVVAVLATGRSDHPNQINNVLAFPGIFRGALNVRACRITEAMKVAASHAIANCITPKELNPEYIIPSVFDRNVVKNVAIAVAKAAYQTGVARKGMRLASDRELY